MKKIISFWLALLPLLANANPKAEEVAARLARAQNKLLEELRADNFDDPTMEMLPTVANGSMVIYSFIIKRFGSNPSKSELEWFQRSLDNSSLRHYCRAPRSSLEAGVSMRYVYYNIHGQVVGVLNVSKAICLDGKMDGIGR